MPAERSNSSIFLRICEIIRHDPFGEGPTCVINLRLYLRGIALAIRESILHRLGLTFVVVLPRMLDKNELQTYLLSWLLFRFASFGGRIVSVSSTFKPQTAHNMDRDSSSIDACISLCGRWRSSKGCMYPVGKACLQFFSSKSHAKVMGATVDLLHSGEEASYLLSSISSSAVSLHPRESEAGSLLRNEWKSNISFPYKWTLQ